MDRESYERNQKYRWEILQKKTKYYGKHSWRNLPITSSLKRALHRLDEVVDGVEDNASIDIDNLVDVQNFLDFVLAKVLEQE